MPDDGTRDNVSASELPEWKAEGEQSEIATADTGDKSIRIGCSGYGYRGWRGVLYPNDLKRDAWFDHYATIFSCVEINNTFYKLPDTDALDTWRERAPSGFTYALKLNRYGTHNKHLKDVDEWLLRFTDRAARLGDTLGPILVQLPRQWHVDAHRLEDFIDAIPGEMRFAFEFRHPSWYCDEVYGLLAEANAALVLHDLLEQAQQHKVTADWTYLRFHGPDPNNPYTGSYSHQSLSAQAGFITGRANEGRESFAFFNNDADESAPNDAQRLARYTRSALQREGSSTQHT